MKITLKQISSLNKVRLYEDLNFNEEHACTALQGQRVSYQVAIDASEVNEKIKKIYIESPLGDCVRLYRVKDVIVDKPSREFVTDENYLLSEPGLLPDVLVPLELQDGLAALSGPNVVIWVKVDLPLDIAPGRYTVKLCVETGFEEGAEFESCEMEIRVIAARMPEQKLIYTRWIYLDCIADAHDAEIFSERHWKLIEEYVAAAADVGINMLLVPVHTPPLDTDVGSTRPCVQLVDIEKKGDRFFFNFDKFRRYIAICKKYGIRYYEIAHLFSQWGSRFAPNIMVTENGSTDYMFGWHVAADSPEYTAFLPQYIGAISAELEREGIADQAYFHVSDEPNPDNIGRYEIAKNILKPLIGNAKTFDALSHYEFCERGLVETPVTSVKRIHEFLEHNIEDQWVYYCCGPERVFTNSFIAMPSRRTRVIGFQIYKYAIKGFLHWGFNFYNSQLSRYKINPYLTTSSDGAFPSGDGFIVYPGKETAYPSIRAEITYEAIQDIDICYALEALIGRDAVIAMIDEAAGVPLRFDVYPDSDSFLSELREKMIETIEKHSK